MKKDSLVEYVLNPAFVGGSEFSGPHDSVVMGEKSLDGGPNGAALAGNRLPGTEGKSRIEDILGFMFPPRKLVTEGLHRTHGQEFRNQTEGKKSQVKLKCPAAYLGF
jgi:hypothetical protein